MRREVEMDRSRLMRCLDSGVVLHAGCVVSKDVQLLSVSRDHTQASLHRHSLYPSPSPPNSLCLSLSLILTFFLILFLLLSVYA